MIGLTKQEQAVLGMVLALLLTGLAVKACRARHAGHPPTPPAVQAPAAPHR